MNFNLCKEYRFAKAKLTSSKSGKVYEFRLDKYDRFYTYIKPHIVAGKVEGQTKLMVDTIEIPNADSAFLNDGPFLLEAIILANDGSGLYMAFELSIKNIRINQVDVSRMTCQDGCLILSLYEMVIPYQTEISIKECVD
jgi:hypothetical protein